jgi:glutathione synthase/RimK-type ligase-like ATP-grasp enzyme
VLADPVIAYLCSRLAARSIEFLLLDGRHYPGRFGLTLTAGGDGPGGEIRYGERRVSLDEVRSVYLRQFGILDLMSDPGREAEVSLPQQREFYGALLGFTEAWGGLVINRPSASASNASKPYQQQWIARYGFATPRTLVTTVPEEARRFTEACSGRVIYKSISGHRSIVRRLAGEEMGRLEQLRGCPTQFQEYIPGVEVRVHTAGSRVFATEIITDAIDYRYAGEEGADREMRAMELPEEVAERCLRLAAGLGLAVAGIDLRRTPEGEYYCLEVNPSPGFTFYQSRTGQRIGEAVVDLLVAEAA